MLNPAHYGDDMAWTQLSSGCNYRKKDGVVYVNITNHVESTVGAWSSCGTLPSEFRPSTTSYFGASVHGTTGGIGWYKSAIIRIKDTGEVAIRADETNMDYLCGYASFPV